MQGQPYYSNVQYNQVPKPQGAMTSSFGYMDPGGVLGAPQVGTRLPDPEILSAIPSTNPFVNTLFGDYHEDVTADSHEKP